MAIRFLDLFAGIGGFRSGLEAVGSFQCVGWCEIDPYVRRAYEAIYDTRGEVCFYSARDIQPDELPDLDLICGGFPCQAFSIAGKRRGFADDTRGTLFFEIARLAEAKRPALLLLENVPGLLSHDQGRTFEVILHVLDELGYDVLWQVLNSKDFGVPQSRNRVYLVCCLREKCAGEVFSFPPTNGAALVTALDGRQGSRIYSDAGLSCTLTSSAGGMGGKTGLYQVESPGLPIKVKTKAGYQLANPGDSIDLSYATQNSRRGRVGAQVAHTLTTSGTQGVYCIGNEQLLADDNPDAPFAVQLQCSDGVTRTGRVRKLLPIECWRLQGFTDEQFYKAQAAGLSDSRLYKMAGNAVSVPVISALGRELKRIYEGGMRP